MDAAELKHAASGRWVEILSGLGCCPRDVLDRKHHPCPKCEGTDRFRMIDEQDGALMCSKCFATENGDGIAALMWLRNWSFPEACEALEEYLGIKNGKPAVRAVMDLVQEIAHKKRIPLESFKAFGAHEAMRGKLKVARVPMYDEFGKVCCFFDMATLDEKWLKGLCETGKSPGLFLETAETLEGKRVIVTEGVKDAAALHGCGYLAIGLPTKEMEIRFARWFAGAEVVIVPDRDIDGEKGARRTAARMHGIATSVRIACLPTEIKDRGGDGVREVLAKRDGRKLLDQCIADAQVFVPGEGDEKVGSTTLDEACFAYLDGIGKGNFQCITTGLPELDYALGGGVQAGEVVVLGARPGNGKSMLGMQLLDAFAYQGMPGLIVSEEMSALALGRRGILYASSVEERDWREFPNNVQADLKKHFQPRAKVYIEESLGVTDKAIQAIDRYAADKKIKVVAVDYVQKLNGTGGSQYERVTYTSAELQRCASRNGIVLFLLAQLNRDFDKRGDAVPRMADLKDSGGIEQDADVILFLQWLSRSSSEYRVYVAKNRNRCINQDIVDLEFEAPRQRLNNKIPDQSRYADPLFSGGEF